LLVGTAQTHQIALCTVQPDGAAFHDAKQEHGGTGLVSCDDKGRAVGVELGISGGLQQNAAARAHQTCSPVAGGGHALIGLAVIEGVEIPTGAQVSDHIGVAAGSEAPKQGVGVGTVGTDIALCVNGDGNGVSAAVKGVIAAVADGVDNEAGRGGEHVCIIVDGFCKDLRFCGRCRPQRKGGKLRYHTVAQNSRVVQIVGGFRHAAVHIALDRGDGGLCDACDNGGSIGISGILALIVAFYGAQIIADTYSQEFNSMLKPFVNGIVDSAVAKVQEENVGAFNEEDVYGVTYDALGNLGILKSAAQDIAEDIAEKVERTGQTMREEIVGVLCSKIAYILTAVVVFLLILIVFTVITNILNLAFKLPGLEFINELFGALFGFAKGAVIVVAIAWIMRYLGVLVDEDIINKTMLLEWLMDHNLVTKFFGF